VRADHLKGGNTHSCGCLQKEATRAAVFVDLTNRIFGRLTVLRLAGRGKRGQAQWFCHCSCGNKEIIVAGNSLSTGSTRSCGCLHKDVMTKHGHAGKRTPEYRSWESAIRRATCETDEHHPNYGGRGITVCPEWRGKNGFANFLAHLGPRSKGTTLDRINPDGNYEPGNVRWAPPTVQTRNRRCTKLDENKVLEIRKLAASAARASIAKQFGISLSAVHDVMSGRRWKEAA
jgi:hypothetical protein